MVRELARAAAESARVPCAALFNECSVDAAVARATQAGFNVVMLADEKADYADLARRVAGVVSLAHPRGVAVEAELGILPSGKGDRHLLSERPSGCSVQKVPVPFPPPPRR